MLGILLGTVSALTPAFVIIAYLPEILRTAGTLVVIAMLAYGAGQVTGTAVVPQLIGRPNAGLALLLGASGVTVFTAALTATRTVSAGAIVTMAALGLAVGLTIVPQQHRLFATVPALAPVAVGLNGSAIYIGIALGAAPAAWPCHRRPRGPHHHRRHHRRTGRDHRSRDSPRAHDRPEPAGTIQPPA